MQTVNFTLGGQLELCRWTPQDYGMIWIDDKNLIHFVLFIHYIRSIDLYG